MELMQVDALYALSELFIFAAFAKNQFLDMIHIQIKESINCLEGNEIAALENGKYSKTILDEHIDNTRPALACLRSGGDPSWPRVEEKGLRQVVNDTVNDLISDYETSIQHMVTLSGRSLEGMNFLRDRVQLKESQTAFQKADGLHRLTVLAFFFLPLSTTSAIFGMNFKEFGTGNLSIWFALRSSFLFW